MENATLPSPIKKKHKGSSHHSGTMNGVQIKKGMKEWLGQNFESLSLDTINTFQEILQSQETGVVDVRKVCGIPRGMSRKEAIALTKGYRRLR